MTRLATRSRLAFITAAILVPAAFAQAVPVMNTSSDGTTFRIDITGARPSKSVWFLSLPAGIDHAVLDNVFAAGAAGAQLIHTATTTAAGEFHMSFPAAVCPQDTEYAAYAPFGGMIRFLGTMAPNPSESSVLGPGVGFTGATPEPPRIGTGTAKAIARWDVVPYQTIVEANDPTFIVGVVAFHIAGIEKVSFSLEGGPWVDVRSMSLNPQTGVWEYCATIDARDFANDRPIEVRAIAYPKAAAPQAAGTGGYPGGGDPRLLNPLRLYVDADAAQAPNAAWCSPSGDDSNAGTEAAPVRTPFRAAQIVHLNGGGSADGGIVFMDAGDYDWSLTQGNCSTGWWGVLIPATNHRWLTFQPWPGVPREQVRIVSSSCPGLAIDRVRLHEITLAGWTDGNNDDSIWMDHATCVGPGPGLSYNWVPWHNGFSQQYWTDVDVRDCSASLPNACDLARNVTAARVSYGLKTPGLIVNCRWDTMSAFGTGSHPGLFNWNFAGQDAVLGNAIIYGVTANDIQGIPIFFKDTGRLRDVAIVNMAVQTSNISGMGEHCQELEHFLMLNVTHRGGFLWSMPRAAMHNVSIRGCAIGGMSIYAGGGGDSVDDGWFDQNHFEAIQGIDFGAINPGTNVTTGDLAFIDSFTPGPASPLRSRLGTLLVPIDKDGARRVAPATIGAVE